MIAYWFPPEGNAATYRPLRFVRHLPAFGWQPAVVSVASHVYERYDPELLGLVPSQVEVVRVRNRDPWQAFQAWRAKRPGGQEGNGSGNGSGLSRRGSPLRAWLRRFVSAAEPHAYFPDQAMGWIGPASAAAAELCGRRRASVIWATGMPWSAFLAARRASHRTGVPYVLDFRSPWTLVEDDFEAMRPGWAKRWDRRTLRRLFEGAQAVILAYRAEAECYWRAYPGALDPARIHFIPNGYDGAIEPFCPPRAERCTVLYSGTLALYRYDTLLDAVEELKRSDPERAGKLRLLFVGEGSERLRGDIAERQLSDLIEVLPPTSYAAILELQRRAHALLMLEREPSRRGHELLAGAKLFGYLRAGRPILGVLPPGEARSILREVGVTTIADASSRERIVERLREILAAWSAGTLERLLPDRAACERYSAERQTAALARALEGLPPEEPFVPGALEVPPSLRELLAPA